MLFRAALYCSVLALPSDTCAISSSVAIVHSGAQGRAAQDGVFMIAKWVDTDPPVGEAQETWPEGTDKNLTSSSGVSTIDCVVLMFLKKWL
jgi:hypothetical protein